MGLLSKAIGKTMQSVDTDTKAAKKPGNQQDGGESPEKTLKPPPEYALVDGLPGELKNEIIKYHNTYTLVHGIVLAYPKNYDEKKEGESFCGQLNRIVATLGSAVPLPSGHSLVLFSNTVDRDLLAHRLSGSLETEAPVVFQADDIKTLMDYIRPYL
jgi:hypothetical protein